jgi:hypothetical protein
MVSLWNLWIKNIEESWHILTYQGAEGSSIAGVPGRTNASPRTLSVRVWRSLAWYLGMIPRSTCSTCSTANSNVQFEHTWSMTSEACPTWNNNFGELRSHPGEIFSKNSWMWNICETCGLDQGQANESSVDSAGFQLPSIGSARSLSMGLWNLLLSAKLRQSFIKNAQNVEVPKSDI